MTAVYAASSPPVVNSYSGLLYYATSRRCKSLFRLELVEACGHVGVALQRTVNQSQGLLESSLDGPVGVQGRSDRPCRARRRCRSFIVL